MEPLSLRGGQVDGIALPEEGKSGRGQSPSSLGWPSFRLGDFFNRSETPREKLHTHPKQEGLGQSPYLQGWESREPSGSGVLGVGPTPQEHGEKLGPAKGPQPQPTPAGRPEAQLRGGGAAPDSGDGRGERPGRAAAPWPRAAQLPGRLAPRGQRRGGGEAGPAACWGSSARASRAAPGRAPNPGSQAPRRDSPERPGSASWCPSGCPCLCSDSTWC